MKNIYFSLFITIFFGMYSSAYGLSFEYSAVPEKFSILKTNPDEGKPENKPYPDPDFGSSIAGCPYPEWDELLKAKSSLHI